MPSITIRDVPQGVRDELAARAQLSGRSLQEFLRLELIELAGKPSNDVVIARARERVARTGTGLTAAQIVESLREDRR